MCARAWRELLTRGYSNSCREEQTENTSRLLLCLLTDEQERTAGDMMVRQSGVVSDGQLLRADGDLRGHQWSEDVVTMLHFLLFILYIYIDGLLQRNLCGLIGGLRSCGQ